MAFGHRQVVAIHLDLHEVVVPCFAQAQFSRVGGSVGNPENCFLRVFLVHFKPFQNLLHSEQVG